MRACSAFWLTDWPQEGPMREADTESVPTPNAWASAALAASFLSPAASVCTRTVVPPMTVDVTVPGMPACAIAVLALSS